MQVSQPSPIARDDTLFGVCEAFGEDFGFNPAYLRVTLAVLLFWNPVAVIGAYAGAGVLVLMSRWLYPSPSQAAAIEPVGTAYAEDEGLSEREAEPLPIAA